MEIERVPPQLIGRVLSGLGTAVYINLLESNKKEINLISSGVTAALAATISTYTFFHLRKWASTRLKIVDGFVGVAEDAISLELGRFLAQEFRLDSIVPEK
ncbi:MAG: hypothetical protein ABIQ95_11835 [Bdellovibrionia bacterium]